MSLTGFGDVLGGGIAFDYMSVRNARPGTPGWQTHAITPGNLEPGTVDEALAGFDPRYMGEFSSDLSHGVFLSKTALTANSSNTEDVLNLYVRDDLLRPGPGTYHLLSDCPLCTTPFIFSHQPGRSQPGLAGASADFSHVIFESRRSLTSEVPFCDPAVSNCPLQLYEWDRGTIRLAGVLPASQGGGAAPNSQAGRSASTNSAYTPNTISQDGSRIFFTLRGSGAPSDGQLYMRVRPDNANAFTIHLNASERIAPDPVPFDARYWTATPDGSRVYFSTRENLVDSDNSDENLSDLYVYDVDRPVGQHLQVISTDAEPSDGDGADVTGVIGTSDDGRYVYFTARGQLVPGGPTTLADRIFVWHDGEVHEVGTPDPAQINELSGTAGWRLGSSQAARVTPAGRQMVFVTAGTDELTAHPGLSDKCGTNHDAPCREIFLFDAAADGGAGRVVCASCQDPDAAATADASFAARIGSSVAGLTSHLNHPLSDNGRFVFFQTPEPLVASDQDGNKSDVYEFDALTGATHLLSNGSADSHGSYFMDASSDGADVFFITRDQLVGWDADDNVDLYDARVNGGLPEPSPLQVPCSGDACRQAAPTPSFAPPASAGARTRGNLTRATSGGRCSRHRGSKHPRRRARCVARRHHGSVRHAANRHGRNS